MRTVHVSCTHDVDYFGPPYQRRMNLGRFGEDSCRVVEHGTADPRLSPRRVIWNQEGPSGRSQLGENLSPIGLT